MTSFDAMSLDEPELDLLLAGSDPLPPAASLLPVDDLPALLRRRSIRRARTRRVRIAAGTATALGVLAATPAAAGFLSAHTGQQTPSCGSLPAGTTCENGTGEQIRLNGQDIGEVYASYTKRYPLPAGQSWRHFLVRVSRPVDGLMAASGIDATVAYSARCQWQHAWLAARAGHDQDGLAAARHELIDIIPGWTVLTSNEVQSPTTEAQVANAVRADQPAYVQQVTDVNCVPGDWGSSAAAGPVQQ